MPNAVENALAVRRVASIAASQVIGWGIVCDSNGLQTDPAGSPDSGQYSGHLQGLPLLVSYWLGFAGTGPQSNHGLTLNNIGGMSNVGATASIPASHSDYLLPTTITAGDGVSSVTSGFKCANQFAYVADASSLSNSAARSLMDVAADARLFSVNDSLTFLLKYGTFSSGTGPQNFRPSVRRSAAGTIVASAGSNISTITGTNGFAWYELAISAATRNFNVALEPHILNSQAWQGPGIIHSVQMIPTAATTGVCANNWTYQGGLGGVEACQSVVSATDAALDEFLKAWIYPQTRLGQTPTLVLQWMHGGNDRNDSGQASFDPDTLLRTGASSHTPAGVRNNCLAFYRRVLARWVALGHDPLRLFLAIGPYHEQAAHVATLASYEDALAEICDLYPNTAWLTRGTEVTDYRVWDDADWYRDGSGEDTDDAHMRRDGYHAVAMATVSAWKAAATAPPLLPTSDVRAGVDRGDGVLGTLKTKKIFPIIR